MKERRRRRRADVLSPTAGNPWFDGVALTLLLAGFFGLTVAFGGTAFWASGPFFILGLLGVFLCQVMAVRAMGRPALAPPLGTVPWLILVVYTLIRAVFVPQIPYQAWTEFLFQASFLLMYVCISDLSNRRGIWSLVLGAVLLATALQAMYSLSLHLKGETSVLWLQRHPNYGMRASGTFICPNHFAAVLHTGMILGLGLILSPRAGLGLKLIAGYTFLVSLPAIGISLSRAGWLGLLVGILVLLIGKAARRGPWMTLGAIVVSALGSGTAFWGLWQFAPIFRTRMSRALTDIRFQELWPDTWRMIQGEGFWGAGPGIFRHRFESYRVDFRRAELYLEHAHNEYLHMIADYGWPGLVLILGALGWLVWALMRVTLRQEDEGRAMIPLMMLAVLLAHAAHAVFDFNFHIPGAVSPLVLVLGCLYGHGLHLGVWKAKPWPDWTGKVFPALTMAVVPLMMAAFVLLAVGSKAGFEFDRARKQNNREAMWLRAAQMQRWTPFHWRGWTEEGTLLRGQSLVTLNPETRADLIAQSREAYETALRWNPFERIALMGLAQLEVQERNFEAAMPILERLLTYDPFDAEVHLQAGLVLRRLGRLEEALAAFEQANRLRPRHAQTQANLRRVRAQIAQAAQP